MTSFYDTIKLKLGINTRLSHKNAPVYCITQGLKIYKEELVSLQLAMLAAIAKIDNQTDY